MPGISEALGEVAGPVSLGLGILETGINYLEKAKAKKEQKKLLSQRKAYQTPQEIFDILNATKANASVGFDPTTLDYLTNETDQAFAGSLGVLNRNGGDPNDASALFTQKINEIMKIGADDHELKTKKFSAYLGALEMVGANKAAEQKSQQDIIKDRLQAEGLNIQNADTNISNGLNTVVGSLASMGTESLYNADGSPRVRRRRNVANSTDYSNAQEFNANNTAGFIR